jgi:hypothetical protein
MYTSDIKQAGGHLGFRPARMKFGLAASSVAGQTMQLVGAEDAFTVSFTPVKDVFMVSFS